MTATHEPMSRHFSGGVEKPGAHPARRQPVPIRPNFRPLLPKPCTHEPLQPNGIHIHTRASLNASRKRNPNSSGKVDSQRRRRPVVSTGKYARPDSIHSAEPNTKSDHTGLAAGLYSTYSQGTPQYSPSPTSDVSSPSPKSPSGVPPLMAKKPSSQYGSLGSSGMAARTSPIDIPTQQTSVSTASIFAPVNGTISPVSIAPESLTSDRAGSFDSLRASDGFEAESPDQQTSASVNSITIDPSSISIEGETMFDLGGGASSASAPAYGNSTGIAFTDKLTPPYTQKNEAFSAFAVGGEFEDFSDIYFRNMPGSDYSLDSSKKPQSSSNSFNDSIEVSEALNDTATTDPLDVGESEFSMLDFLAPSLDLF